MNNESELLTHTDPHFSMRNTQGQWPSSIENNGLNMSRENRSTGQNFYGNQPLSGQRYSGRGPHIADDNTTGDTRKHYGAKLAGPYHEVVSQGLISSPINDDSKYTETN